ncbi:MAG: hypothetical protein PUJ51_19335 [Clostridiales bacterium]|nr:hypothetical protein [Clostridiales bacterium]
MANKLCQKCGKMLDEDTQFYTYKDGTKTEMCKKCLTMHIDNFDESTYLWLLEKMDVPYIPEEWNVLRERAYAKNPNLNGMSVFGKYLSKMKLKQYKQYGWADTDKLNALNDEKRAIQKEEREKFEEEIKKQFEAGEIGEAEYKTMISAETQNKEYMSRPIAQPEFSQDKYFSENNEIVQEQMNSLISELTQEDKKVLAMKWGVLYRPEEWIELEKDYNNMMNSFDIQDADTINTLILICKTNLKMNQALDAGDIEGYQKLSKVSESLRKSAKFTAAQNKEQKNDYVDCVGELVTMCEKDGFIPRFETDIPQDKVDLTLKDMENYLYKLVTQDLGFGQQIEDALKKIQIQKEMNENVEDILEDDDPTVLIDQDYEEFYNSVSEQKEQDSTLGDEE